MSKLLVFSVLDAKVGAFARPYFAPSKAAAIRAFGDVARDPAHEVGRHPEDYTLYHVGLFDELTGQLENGIHDALVTASACKELAS
nr:MAG: nonstructural protein [Microvirus sp.]